MTEDFGPLFDKSLPVEAAASQRSSEPHTYGVLELNGAIESALDSAIERIKNG